MNCYTSTIIQCTHLASCKAGRGVVAVQQQKTHNKMTELYVTIHIHSSDSSNTDSYIYIHNTISYVIKYFIYIYIQVLSHKVIVPCIVLS